MEDTSWIDEVLVTAQNVRRRGSEVCIANNGGYLVQVCSSAEILVTLFSRLMDLGPSSGPMVPAQFEGVPRPGEPALIGSIYSGNRDRFLLSPAHYALGLYSTLVEMGRLSDDVLNLANADGSTLEMIGAEHSPGFATTAGSLAQTLSVAIGQALALKRRAEPHRVWTLISDGELEEGQTWEALQVASNFELGNLTVYLDANGLQVDGWVKDVMQIEPIAEKVRAFGWDVIEVDGHDPEQLWAAGNEPSDGRPRLVVCRTQPYRGIPSLKDRHQLHYIRFRSGEVETLRRDLSALQGV
ncbi:transketolase [Glaciihabitans sp. INWT7]|uniref:transketolase n=1 Tax=Glaciihabitans sp. INWT7 TaxID=2596912 RepID=UPI0016259F62|nr:thiamine pyrophosphate-dependent enzyme [Glaciihabitans sp. INWT7]QNE46182.1 transketolase [Glaciihabitans sp. INWT7]